MINSDEWHGVLMAGQAASEALFGEGSPTPAKLMPVHYRKIVPHVCPVCNKIFNAVKIAKFCSNRCRCKDYRDAKK